MLLNNKNINLKDLIKLIPWIIIALSIGTQPSDFELIGKSKAGTFNAIRIFFALTTSLIIIIFFFKDIISNFIRKKNEINFKEKYFIFYLFLIYYILQLFGYLLNFADLKNSGFSDNLYLIVLSFAFIAYFFLIRKQLSSETLKFFLFFLYFLICSSGIIFTIVHISKSSLESANYFSLYNSVLSQHQFFMNHELPRVTGISRSLSILNIIFIFFYFYNVKNKIKFWVLPVILTLSILIFAFQSRGTIICFVLSVCFLIFLFKNEKLKDKLYILIVSIILSYFIYEGVRFFQFEAIKNEKNISIFSPFKSDKKIVIPFEKEKINNILIDKNRLLDFTSSGRTELWKKSFQEFKKNKIFGYGPQGDRYLLRENIKTNIANNVSNGYIYSILSSGYMGFLVFLIIIIYLCVFLFRSLFVYRIYKKKNNLIEKLSLTFFFYFLLRLCIENSFAVFGIDFIIVFAAIGLFLLKDKNYVRIIL